MEREGQAAGPASGARGPAFVKDLEELLVTLRRSSKDLSFYPPGHPLLNRSLERAVSQLRGVVDARAPLALVVSRTGFSFEGRPVGAENQQVVSMAGELFVKRVQRIFFAQEVEPHEAAAFLQMLISDPKHIFQAGGPAKFLAAHDVHRIQVNEFDFQRLGAASGSPGRGAGTGAGGEGGSGEGGGRRQGAGAGGAGGPGGIGAAEAGGTGPAGQKHGAGAAGMVVGFGPAGAPGGAAGAAVSDPALEGQGLALQGGQGAGGQAGGAGHGGVASAQAPAEPGAGQTPSIAEALLASLGSREEQTVESLLRRLDAEAASGGVAGYEWAASRLEAAAGQAVGEDRLAEVLAILRSFLRHRQDENLGAPIRGRAAQAVEAVATEDTAAYLIEHLGSAGLGADLAEVLLGLGAPVIPPLLGRLAAENQEATRARLVEILGRFREVALPHLTEAVQQAGRDLACDLARILGEIGGETGVALLGRLARHREVQVRTQAVHGLARIGATSAHRLLMQALRDPDAGVVELALGFLGAARVRQSVPAILRLAGQPVLAGSAFTLRKAAVVALGAVGDPALVSFLTRLLYVRTWFRRAAGDELRLAAAQALLSMGRAEAREVVEAGARSRRADVRRACSAALQKRVAPAPANP